MRWIIYAVFAVLYLLVAFFGIGPILLADGSMQERIITLLIVILIFVLLTIVLRQVIRALNRRR